MKMCLLCFSVAIIKNPSFNYLKEIKRRNSIEGSVHLYTFQHFSRNHKHSSIEFCTFSSMKTLYYTIAFALSLTIVACTTSEESSKDSDPSKKTEETAKQLGQKVPAPVINIGEFAKMNNADLRLARNTVFAKYGRIFKSKDLKEHFAKQDWYTPNPRFKETNLSKQDKDLVRLISSWEGKTDVLLKEQADITGNGSYEYCYVLYNKNKGTYTVIINDFSQEFDHFWGQHKDDQKAPADWTEITTEIVDIDPEDFMQEVRISQRYDDWEDPGTHNVIVAFDKKKGVQITEIGSTDYDAGTLTFNQNGTVTMQQSNCPVHTKEYQLKNGTLEMVDETILPPPPGGCAACFSGDSRVATSINESKRIDQLQRGDRILSFDPSSQSYFETSVKRILTVYHDDLIQVSFGKERIITTKDHPFLTTDGWASFAPETTMERYGYQEVKQLKKGTMLVGTTAPIKIAGITTTDEGMLTYTISTLESGNNFVINGVVVGTETITQNL